jgi:hypothetical protein
MTDTLNDEDILALAAKIKHQREIDFEYAKAYSKLNHLSDEVFGSHYTSGSKFLRPERSISISFFTTDASYREETTTVLLPVRSGEELIDWLWEHTGSQYGGEQAND